MTRRGLGALDPLSVALGVAIAVGILRVVIVIAVALGVGCSYEPNVARSIQDARRSLVGVDVGAMRAVEAIASGQQAADAACRAELEYSTCMGVLAEPITPKVKRLSDAYNAAADALEALEDAALELERMHEEAERRLDENKEKP